MHFPNFFWLSLSEKKRCLDMSHLYNLPSIFFKDLGLYFEIFILSQVIIFFMFINNKFNLKLLFEGILS